MKKALIFFIVLAVVLTATVSALSYMLISKKEEVNSLKGEINSLNGQVKELTPHKALEVNEEQSVIYLSLSSRYFYDLEEAAEGNPEFSGGKLSETAMASLFDGYDTIVYFDQATALIGVRYISVCEITLADNNNPIVIYHLPGDIYVPVVTSEG